MRIVTLSGSGGWHVQDLARAAASLGHELVPRNWRSLAADVAGNITAEGVNLHDAEAVLLRTMPPGSLEQIVLRMDLMHRLTARGVRVVNPPLAIESAVDKFLALEKIAAAGVPVPPTVACQRLAEALDAFERLGRDVVVKPLFGSEGFGVTRVTDADVAARVFATLERMGSVIYLQKFIDHGGSDIRVFVIGDHAPAAMRRANEKDWRTNIARGGTGQTMRIEPLIETLATRAAQACGAWVAGVDVMIGPDGPCVIEVNGVPGWRELARVTGQDIAAMVLRFVAEPGYG